MADGWGPIHKATTDGKSITEEGAVTQPKNGTSQTAAPAHPTNYDATDGRHTKPNHEGWESISDKSGDGWESPHGGFHDGPGPFRQT
jgi:hypothetical protein